MLAKHETAMKASKTVLGRVPAKLNTRVIKSRSILVLLNADAIVKPPMSNMIVGENIIENTNLEYFSSDRGWIQTRTLTWLHRELTAVLSNLSHQELG